MLNLNESRPELKIMLFLDSLKILEGFKQESLKKAEQLPGGGRARIVANELEYVLEAAHACITAFNELITCYHIMEIDLRETMVILGEKLSHNHELMDELITFYVARSKNRKNGTDAS